MSSSMEKIRIICFKEWQTYVNTPIGYIFSSFFLLLIGFLFFFGLGNNSFWDMKIASMEQYFSWLPIIYIIFIPAVTMRLWSEEEKTGTFEVLMTLPVKDFELVIGKFFASWLFIGLILLFTLLTPFTILFLGGLDLGIVFCGYLGSFLLSGAYIGVGILISSLTKDQISSYILTLLACLILFLAGFQPILQFFGEFGNSILSFISVSHHFESFRMGILDFREVFYFLTFISLMLSLNIIVLKSKK